MLENRSCIPHPILTQHGVGTPIPWGKERGMRPWKGPCGDCGTPRGGFHHRGCDLEECPYCRSQLLSCGCLDDEEHEEESDSDELLEWSPDEG